MQKDFGKELFREVVSCAGKPHGNLILLINPPEPFCTAKRHYVYSRRHLIAQEYTLDLESRTTKLLRLNTLQLVVLDVTNPDWFTPSGNKINFGKSIHQVSKVKVIGIWVIPNTMMKSLLTRCVN